MPVKTEPLFKVGDLVRIKPRLHNAIDYRYFYTSDMLQFVGHTAKVRYVKYDNDVLPHIQPDDSHGYLLDIDGRIYYWASSMLEKAHEKKKYTFKFTL